MAAIVGDAILSSVISLIVNKLSSSDLLNFARGEKILKDLKKWEQTLLKIHAVLQDADEKQITNRAVKIWLDDLRDLAYDTEDLLDEFSYEILRRRVIKAKASSSKVRKFFTSLNLTAPAAFNVKMGSKMKDISVRFREIVAQKNDLDLRESGSGVFKTLGRLPSTSLVDESRVFGRDNDKDAILELLFSGEAIVDNDEVSVVPIVGMGGVGKTTLAQLVYNDDRVKHCFDVKAWVCVSEEFDVVGITKTILQSVSFECCGANDLNLLQVKLKEKLMGKKFLVVLDDVWNEDYGVWTVFRKPFEAGMMGSKIVVTTRNQGVASVVGTVPAYCLNELANEDCLCLFAQHALGRRDFDSHPNLKVIGEEIVRRCKGLPLAAKTLGGLLRTKRHYDEWENVLNSKIWDLPEEKSSILPALRLSYHYLPSYLKQCFAFCAVFPKDYEFNKDELISLWMAEGFLLHPRGNKQMEDAGCQYFDELLSRSFFQQSSIKGSQRFVMHDLINDLAQFVAGETCFNLNDKLEGNKVYTVLEKARHMSFTRHTYEVSQRFKDFHTMKCLRTFIALPIYTSSWAACCYISHNVLHDLLPRLRCLRALSLSGYCFSELPNSIGGLKHLRYFNLSHAKIKQLPESVGSLFNLQILILLGCRELTKLPQSMENLINLHCLDITDTDRLQEMPLRIGNLKSLQILSKFIVRKANGFGIRELRDLRLRGKLSILGLHNVLDIRDARDANLRDKDGLDELELVWSDNNKNSRNEEGEMHVLELLQPHKNLKKLKVSFYSGIEFPPWIGDPLFTNIVSLYLNNCRESKSLPPLGRLPSLRELFIDGMDRVESVGFEFLGVDFASFKPFPSLETLQFENMLNWKSWSCPTRANEEAEEEFSCLRELIIRNCPKLTGELPGQLPSLVKLIILQCPKLADALKTLPSLDDLHIEECNGMVLRSVADLPSLTTLKIKKMSQLTCLPERFVRLLGALKILTVSDCTELTSLWQKEAGLQSIVSLKRVIIDGCSQLGSLENIEQSLPHLVEDLKLLNCDNLVKFPYGLHSLMFLKDLQIESCPKLVSFPETDFPSTLKHLLLRDCPSLKSLPCGLMVLNWKSNRCLLEDLEIEYCSSLISFPRGQLPCGLRRLKIQYCTNLQSLPEGIMHNDDRSNISCLENLEIIACPSLPCFPVGKLPVGLKKLKIWDFSESLSERILPAITSSEYIGIMGLLDCLLNLTCLTELSVNNCPGLKSFPAAGLHLPNLRTISIYNCVNLKSLPVQMQDLTSLQDLTICGCPALKSFPKGGLPPNLTSLEIWDCENFMEPMSEWNLHKLTSLKDLSIAGGHFLPDEKCILPINLISIWIGRLDYLEYLSMGLRNLTSLEELEIVRCPNLRSLPKEGLPATLGRLSIKDCPLLRQQCSKEKGEYWPMIACIPCIEIDDIDTMN